MRRVIFRAATLAALAVPLAAHAQTEAPPAETVFDGDFLTVGIGAGYTPSYEGSDDYVFFPQPVIQGRLAGIDITPRPGGFAGALHRLGNGCYGIDGMAAHQQRCRPVREDPSSHDHHHE